MLQVYGMDHQPIYKTIIITSHKYTATSIQGGLVFPCAQGSDNLQAPCSQAPAWGWSIYMPHSAHQSPLVGVNRCVPILQNRLGLEEQKMAEMRLIQDITCLYALTQHWTLLFFFLSASQIWWQRFNTSFLSCFLSYTIGRQTSTQCRLQNHFLPFLLVETVTRQH